MSIPLPSDARQRVFGVAIDGVVLDSSWCGSAPAIRGGHEGSSLEAYVLRRFRQEPDALDRWYEACQRGDVQPRQVTVFFQLEDLTGYALSPVYDLTLRDAWPSKWEDPARGGSFVETITLTCAGATQEERPSPTFSTRVCIDGVPVESSQFLSIEGVVSDAETMEFMHGPDAEIQKQLGQEFFEDIRMKRARGEPDAIDRWYEACQRGDVQRRDVQVYLLLRGTEIIVRRMILNEARPLRIEPLPGGDPAQEAIVFRCSWVTQEGC